MKKNNHINKIVFVLLFSMVAFNVVTVSANNPEYSKAGFWEVKNCGRKIFNFNVGWRFFKGDVEGASLTEFDDSKWQVVNCPHGLEYNSTEASGSSNYQGPAWYRKHFLVEDYLSQKVIKVYFEAVMGKCTVWLNGEMVGEHFGGYLPFMVDLTGKIKPNEDNVLVVRADNSDDPTYPPGKEQSRLDFSYFGGVYRDVWLVMTNKIYVSNPIEADKVAGGGVFTHVRELSDEAVVVATQVDIQNDLASSARVQAAFNWINKDQKVVASSKYKLVIRPGKSSQIEDISRINRPSLWTPWSPSLYRLEIVLTNSRGEVVDGVAIKTGLRKIEFKGREGLFLNNRPYPGKLMGANRHQDHAYVGNALPNNGQWRDALILKDGGCDIIRAAHYPADPAFMDACDALGLFFIEATPGWHFWNAENPIFVERVFSDIRHMVRRDRNYASVVMWEPVLNETGYPFSFAKKAHELVHQEYPYPGAFTVSDNRADGQEFYDVLYANDYNADYENESRCYFQREWGDNVDDFNAQNSTSRVARGWGERPQLVQAKTYAEYDFEKVTSWESLSKTPRQFVGGALWCGFDHQRGYGAEPFFGGLTDVFRQPKYSYFLFASQREVSQGYEPMVYVANEMTPFSSPDVTVFTNCDEVRLTLYEGEQIIQRKTNPSQYLRILTSHGQPSRTEKKGIKAIPHPYVTFDNLYEFMDVKSLHRGGKKYSASIVVEGLIDGKVVTQFTRVSGKRPTRLQLTVENRDVPLVADGSDFVLVVASIVDEKGNVKRLNENWVNFEVRGEGAIIANGDAKVQANPMRVSWGTAPVLIRSSTKPGKILVKASILNEGVNTPLSDELVFESVSSDGDFLFSEVGTENDKHEIVRIEKSAEEELRQENDRLKKEVMRLKLKEEERNQLDQDENR